MSADGSVTVVPHGIGGATLDGESFEPEFAATVDGATQLAGSRAPCNEQAIGRTRFLQEVSLLMKLRHPNVLLYMGACVDPQYPLCIVSELIDGGSLYTLLHGRGNSQLTLAQKMRMTQDIARGMLYLHSCNPVVLHRDLKSANILVERQNNNQLKAIIIDFGLSRLNTAQASLVTGAVHGLCGSLLTMAPEVMRDDGYSAKSDVYSFGIICWEIFTQRLPFRGVGPVQLMQHVASEGRRPPFRQGDDIPEEMRSLIEACWKQDPRERLDFIMIVRKLNQIKHRLNI